MEAETAPDHRPQKQDQDSRDYSAPVTGLPRKDRSGFVHVSAASEHRTHRTDTRLTDA